MAPLRAIWAKRTQNSFGKLAKSPVAWFVPGNNLPPVVAWKQIQNYSLYAAPINKCV